ncbi:MAG: hypothetical protein AAF702_43990 [Chloroflexota bacterium]
MLKYIFGFMTPIGIVAFLIMMVVSSLETRSTDATQRYLSDNSVQVAEINKGRDVEVATIQTNGAIQAARAYADAYKAAARIERDKFIFTSLILVEGTLCSMFLILIFFAAGGQGSLAGWVRKMTGES